MASVTISALMWSADGVAQHFPGVSVPDRAQEHVPFTAGQIRDVGQPHRIQPAPVELPLDQVRRERRPRVDHRRLDLERARADALQPDTGHDLRDGLRSHHLAPLAQFRGDP
jgi:hypothetical protein